MKLISQYLQEIPEVWIYPTFSLIFFLVIYLAVLLMAKKLSNNYVNEMSKMPLDNDELIDNPKNLIK